MSIPFSFSSFYPLKLTKHRHCADLGKKGQELCPVVSRIYHFDPDLLLIWGKKLKNNFNKEGFIKKVAFVLMVYSATPVQSNSSVYTSFLPNFSMPNEHFR